MKKVILSICFVFTLFSCSKPTSFEVTSPNGQIKVSLENTEAGLIYDLYDNGEHLIVDSGISILNGLQSEVLETNIKEVDKTWNPVWGQFSEINDNYKELELSLDYQGTLATLYIRAYDNGIAFRFKSDKVSPDDKPVFFIEYGLAKTDKLYSPAGEGQPIGPMPISELESMGSEIKKLKMPLVIENTEHTFLSLLESDLVSAPGFKVINFKFDKERNKLISANGFYSEENSLVTPWRVILLEEEIGSLLTNTVPLNVAAPNQIENTSWIKPGKTLWDWRVHGYTAEDGFTYGINNESYYRFIDFAAENGILTILKYNKPDQVTDYVNSMWEIQDKPFEGDVINAYNDGAPEPGAEPLGPFYELETSSPALALKAGGQKTHMQLTCHMEGDEDALNPIIQQLFGVSIDEIKTAFQ